MRHAFTVSTSILCVLVATLACSDTGSGSDSDDGGSAGEGAAGSSSGGGGRGGSSGTAGSGGSSGGTAGNGATGGSGATGGTVPTGGTAGDGATGGNGATGGSAGDGATGGSGGTGPLCEDYEGGAFIEFQIVEETLRVWIENEAFVTEAERLLAADETRVPVFNTLVEGTDCDPQWSWHPDPNDAEFADFTIELCDAIPSYIEENKAEWFDSVGQWCPWSARVTSVTQR